ncbi:MAG: TDP-N-acetylfucosamine:lipid II N-acetylfucosaminyltransferase [Motiliproteus sp.]
MKKNISNERTASQFIVHVTVDEKFIDMALREFEAVAPGINRSIILGNKRQLRYVKSEVLEFHTIKSAKALVRSTKCGAVIFHSLNDLTLLSDIPKDKKVIWLGWGYDYYDRLLVSAYPQGLFLPKTRELSESRPKPPLALTMLRKYKSIAKLLLGRKTIYHPKLLERVDVFSPVIDVEHQMACNLNSWFKSQYVTWNYGTVEDDLSSNNLEYKPVGNNILVGNSASFENNHLEVFDNLERCVDLTGRKIIVPLSYGDDWYKEQLITVGREMFGDKFVPLTRFMDKDAYLEILQSCGHSFMNHLRQQALGNICIMMLKGSNIYMSSASPLYRWFLDRGAVIQSIDARATASVTGEISLAPLSSVDQINNIQVIKAHWGRDIQRIRTRQLVDVAMGSV